MRARTGTCSTIPRLAYASLHEVVLCAVWLEQFTPATLCHVKVTFVPSCDVDSRRKTESALVGQVPPRHSCQA